MLLMQDHNKSKYLIFLQIVHRLRLNWICCCWRNMVANQLEELELKSVDVRENKQKVNRAQKSVFETEDQSLQDQRIDANPMELSAETSVRQ